MSQFTFSSESVSEGHPDKVADQISDAVLDAMLTADPYSRVACESFVTAHRVTLGGEITCAKFDDINVAEIVRRTIDRIGYNNDDQGMWNGANMDPVIDLVPQSPDIAMGTSARTDSQIGAGDQGMMFGYAQRNHNVEASTDDYMPVPISIAHALTKRMSDVRRDGTLPYIRPDTKSQVSVRFDDNSTPVAIDAVVLAAQHAPDVDQTTIQADLKEHVVNKIVPSDLLHEDTNYFINHTGKFVLGGPAADTGLTGRKIIVDTYGGWAPHGGGAFSGKDCIKVDRSAAYYARFASKNLVAAGVAEKLQIQVAYSIGSLLPVSYHVQTFGTGKISDGAIVDLLKTQFSFAPGDIITELGLRDPIFEPTAAYGHFGRRDIALPWEALSKVEAVTEQVGTLA